MSEQVQSPLYLIIIDPSLNRSGWAVFDISAAPRLIDYGYVTNNHFPTDKTGNKLIHLEMVLQTLKFAYYPQIVIKEEWVPPSGHKEFGVSKVASQTAYLLAMTHGAVKKVFNNHIVDDINNKEFKKFFTGDGSADKDKVAEFVQLYRTKIWHRTRPLTIRTDDESDAIGIGIYWLLKNGRIKRIEVKKK